MVEQVFGQRDGDCGEGDDVAERLAVYDGLPVKRAAMRIALSSSAFRRPFAAGELTQLEWVERCAAGLGADGIVCDLADFPRTDAEYVAQLRKVAVDLGIVPFGLDAPAFLDPAAEPGAREATLALASGLGALVLRTQLPAPGDVPPAAFVEAAGVAKTAAKAAKGVNVTLLLAARPGTLAEDTAGLHHLIKDVDSAWLRACPRAAGGREGWGPKERFPAFEATAADDPRAVAAAAERAWVILDAPAAERPWDLLGDALAALRAAAAEHRLIAG